MSFLEKTKNIISTIVGFCIIAGIVGGLIYWYFSKSKREIHERDRIEQIVRDMVVKHNASTQWRENFVDYGIQVNGFNRPIYTSDVETALINNDSKSIMFYGAIFDVKSTDAEYYLVFRTLQDVDITFKLKCDEEQAERAMSTPEGYYAIVSIISDIESSKYEIDSDHRRASNVIVINSFIAKGRCLDFLFLGRNVNPFEFDLRPQFDKSEDPNLLYDHELEEKLSRELRKR